MSIKVSRRWSKDLSLAMFFHGRHLAVSRSGAVFVSDTRTLTAFPPNPKKGDSDSAKTIAFDAVPGPDPKRRLGGIPSDLAITTNPERKTEVVFAAFRPMGAILQFRVCGPDHTQLEEIPDPILCDDVRFVCVTKDDTLFAMSMDSWGDTSVNPTFSLNIFDLKKRGSDPRVVKLPRGPRDRAVRRATPMTFLEPFQQLFMVGSCADQVLVFSKRGKFKTQFGLGGCAAHMPSDMPHAICSDGERTIFVADDHHGVSIFQWDGERATCRGAFCLFPHAANKIDPMWKHLEKTLPPEFDGLIFGPKYIGDQPIHSIAMAPGGRDLVAADHQSAISVFHDLLAHKVRVSFLAAMWFSGEN